MLRFFYLHLPTTRTRGRCGPCDMTGMLVQLRFPLEVTAAAAEDRGNGQAT